eukprot:6473330-Amphidinium_carterae.1
MRLTELEAACRQLKAMHREERFVVNVPSDVVHKCLVGCTTSEPAAWRTVCGWKCGLGRFRIATSTGQHWKCARCFVLDDDTTDEDAAKLA